MALIGSRHAFTPLNGVPYRCARCLRQIDCAPHLPVAPRDMTTGEILGARSHTPSEIQRLCDVGLATLVIHQARSRAAR